MMEKWNGLPKKDQNLIIILVTALIVGSYLGLIYRDLHEDIFEVKKLVSRKENRIKVRDKTIRDVKEDPNQIQKKIEALAPKLAKIRNDVITIKEGFVNLEDGDKVAALRLEISEHARFSNVAINSMETVGGRPMDSIEAPDSESRQTVINNPYKRLLIQVNSYTTFHGLLTFLDGLDELSYYAAVVQVKIKAIVPELEPGEIEPVKSKQLINAEMIIAI